MQTWNDFFATFVLFHKKRPHVHVKNQNNYQRRGTLRTVFIGVDTVCLFSLHVISLCSWLTSISSYLEGKSVLNYIWCWDSAEFPGSIILAPPCVVSAVRINLGSVSDAYPQELPMQDSTSCQDTGRRTWRPPCWSELSCLHLSVVTRIQLRWDTSHG